MSSLLMAYLRGKIQPYDIAGIRHVRFCHLPNLFADRCGEINFLMLIFWSDFF
jgi:hypothetical protein